MHGRPRKPAKPEEDAASIEKAAKLRSLQSQLLHNHQNKIYAKEALEISSKLLELNPEFYTAWNYRKHAVQHILLSETDTDSIKSILNEELSVVESALRRNFKSYGAWHHRKWVLSKGYSSMDHEFWLLDKFQKADPRNFHAWNYRRFVAELKNVPAEAELKYTTDMIDTNLSNYSAWHNRSVILSRLQKQKAEGFDLKNKVLTEEYELVHQALFTDPDDQSGWFYHLWLLDQTVTSVAPILMSSWPVHGSDLVVSLDRNLTADLFSPFSSFCSNDGAFPLILYFNQAVGGVNSCTVTIRYMFCKNEDLIWRPLSVSHSGKAQAWMTYLKFPDLNINSFETYPVEVSLGHTQGIISSTGSSYSFPSQFTFTVRLQTVDSEHSEGDTRIKMVSWKDESFRRNAVLGNFSTCVLSLNNLTISNDNEPAAMKWQIETITYEIALFRELLLEIPCKIGKLTLARLLMAHDAIMSYNSPSVDKKVNSEEVLELFGDLMKLDPSHLRYYKDECSVVLMEQVASNTKSLEKHCWYYGESTYSLPHNTVCLRLNNLSLSRLGSLEHLLWVQMLDLRHNELKSIEGLETLQLLTCLNLSYNKFSSFTALKPLRLLNSLKVLDISYNEIGSHPVDTTRYLCSSPLCRTVGDDDSVDEYVTDDVKIDYWEAVLIFKGMQLTQLDVVGNAVSDEKFSFLLIKVLPKLIWLDGKAVH